jgi:glyoxylase-like metal-dependent hydrolase (beta-lactamase superfamily II)
MKVKCLPVGPIGTNCYIVCDEDAKVCAIIDPGGDAGRVESVMRQTGCTPACILLTHGHYDHVGAVAELRQRYPDIPVYLNSRDIRDDDSREARFLYPHLPGELRNYDEGDQVSVGNLTFEVLATPGHTPGSVTLKCGDSLFCGDTLFCGSCGRTDMLGGDYGQMEASLRKLGRLEGNIWPGHMDPTTVRWERQSNPYLVEALRSPE